MIGAISATSEYFAAAHATVYFNAPWFIIIDSMGNILKDTLYNYHDYWEGLSGVEGSHLYKDKNSGYFHFGYLNQVTVATDINDYHNFPSYFAHLDTNFRIDWIRTFPYSDTFGKRFMSRIMQTTDSNYLLYGVMQKIVGHCYGWMAKLDKHGNILWQRTYLSDSIHDAYIEALVEKQDGNFVFVGATFNDTLPVWHNNRDVWLVGLDSSGCDVGGCEWAVGIKEPVLKEMSGFELYPNPASILINIQTKESGVLSLYSMDGRMVMQIALKTGKTELNLPIDLSNGIYLVEFVNKLGEKSIRRLVVI